MALVNMRELLKGAAEGGYAVGSFSAGNMECIRGIIRAAERCRSPVILQVAEIRLPYSPLPLIGPMMLGAAREASVPVAVHLDHGKSLDVIQKALEIGFTSVMCDGSELNIAENVRLTREVVRMAEKTGAAVEAEVGRVGRGEDGSDVKEEIASLEDCLTMDAEGIDALAVGIGNAHGIYAQTPELHYEVLESAAPRLKSSLVLHGGSGLTDEQFSKVIALGIRKVNIATDVFRAASMAMGGSDLFRGIEAAAEAVSEVVAGYMVRFGSTERV